MATGDTVCSALPANNEPPSSNFATDELRNGHPLLAFDATTQETAIFTFVMPRHYSGGSIQWYIHVTLASATSGTVGFDLAMERMSDGSTDIDSDSFATAVTFTATTVPGTSGVVLVLNATISSGDLDGVAAGDSFRVRVRRDVANDTAAGDAQIAAVEGKEN